LRERFRERVAGRLAWFDVGGEPAEAQARGAHTPELAPLWEEMTMVRRSVPGAQW
jgi:1,2-phenylacetyl-CoA epoxidase catalytic subunit